MSRTKSTASASAEFTVTQQPIIPSIEHIPVNMREYIDHERMEEMLTKIVLPKTKETNSFIALFLKYQYKLPVRYLEPIIDQCYYVSQKSPIPSGSKHVVDASITIEPNNQNVFKQISYTPINQDIPEGTIVSLSEAVPWDGDRMLLTSASLVCSQPLCNRCIPYTTIDIGSEIVGKFVVKNTRGTDHSLVRESMSLYHFRRPADNILEIITPTYLNVNARKIFELFSASLRMDGCESELASRYVKEILDQLP